MVADTYPLLNIFFSILFFFIFFLWIFLLIQIIIDLFRKNFLSGAKKALWIVFLLIAPFIGVLAYLIVHGGDMQKHQIDAAKEQQAAFSDYVRQTAGSGDTVPDQLHKLSDLKDRGVITQAEFDAQKAKLLG